MITHLFLLPKIPLEERGGAPLAFIGWAQIRNDCRMHP